MKKFNGPVFIVGMPRSGTKLFRSLLNNHSKLAFSPAESQILPYWYENWHKFGDLTDFANFEKFYNDAIKHSFFTYMEKRESNIISAKEWYQACKGGSVAEVFEALIRLDTNCSQETIWGDKSPSYIKHIPLLRKIYPHAKIIHIVRDVRDYCLSINKAWGKNMIRAAQRWQNDTTQASKEITLLGQDGLEIQFEELLANPTTTLQNVCNFLDIDFEEQMISLDKPTENIGDAKGEVIIVTTNKDKWQSKMSPKLLKEIESICITQLKKYHYPSTYTGKQIHISKIKLEYYRILDGFNLLIRDINNRGMIKNLIFLLRDNQVRIRN